MVEEQWLFPTGERKFHIVLVCYLIQDSRWAHNSLHWAHFPSTVHLKGKEGHSRHNNSAQNLKSQQSELREKH